MQSFEFKPALLRGRNNWTLDSGMLTRNGQLFCSLSSIDSARFGEMRSQRAYSAWLDLHAGEKRHRIACNIARGDKNNVAFMHLAGAILGELSLLKPDLQVQMGAGAGVKWAMFIIGFVSLIFGVMMLAAAPLGFVDNDRMLTAYLTGGTALLFGGWLCWQFRFWKGPDTMPAASARLHVLSLAPSEKPAGQ